MPRIDPAPGATHASLFVQVLEHCPDIAERWSALGTTVRFSGVLPPELKEEVRRSTAEQIGCEFCASFGAPKSEYTDEREALAVRLARTIADDPKLVDDAMFEELHRHFTDQEIVELVAQISFVVIGGQTFGTVMGIESASPEYALVYEQWVEDNMVR
jgi:alkylhydroperoxidase family enzyme